jgi:exopolyphosphatase / guanosine-5'-triphosphate,3'-diphosphate pyrophosphatase
MGRAIRAVIDIGTNSVKLLIAEVADQAVRPLHETSHQTRLGQGFYERHILQPGAIRETANAVAEFAAKAKNCRATGVKVIATSAARDARNREHLLSAVSEASGLEVTVISGEQEADWAYRGVTSDPNLALQPLLVMDVGGGSTEFILGQAGKRFFGESFLLGSVRLLEKLSLNDPPTPEQLEICEQEVDSILENKVRPNLDGPRNRFGSQVQLVGTGGTSTILARVELRQETFNREEIEGILLSHEQVRREKQRLWSLPLEARRNIAGLPANRADVILPGVVIFERVMGAFGFQSLRVSTRGIRFAALMDQ